MSQLTHRIERGLREIAAGAQPSASSWDSIVARIGDDDAHSEEALVLVPAPGRSRRPALIAAAAALVMVAASAVVLATVAGDDQSISSADPDFATNPSSPRSTVTDLVPEKPPTTSSFVGIWVSTDVDGSSQTMEIVASETEEYEVVVHDDAATAACSGAVSTMRGMGLLETDETLIIARPELTCGDGTTPTIGPAPQAELADFTLELDDATDQIVDRFGVVWRRSGPDGEPVTSSQVTVPPFASNDELMELSQGTVPAVASATSGGMWPQSTSDEVRAAQQLADDGDPEYTWQLDAELAAGDEPWGANILTRFIEDGLGWDDYISGASFSGFAGGEGGRYEGILFLRCAPNQTNPLSPLYAQVPFEIRGCAPTIDDLTYETVGLSVTQPHRRGPSGIWVVDTWDILQSEDDPGSLFGALYPDFFAEIQVEQSVPPTDTEVAELLQAFLRARVDGEGAEQHVLREPAESWAENTDVPLLYATTGGVPYERSEMELVQGPVWPTGWTEYKVRLFAEAETVVEQYFHVARHDGRLGLVYGYASNQFPTTENGNPVAVPQNILGDTATLTAPPLIPRGDGVIEISLTAADDSRVIVGADPVPMNPIRDGCLEVPVGTALPQAADAAELARDIQADPDFVTTEPVPVSIAGIDGLQMDVSFTDEDVCYSLWSPSRDGSGTTPRQVTADATARRMRLFLVDYPGSTRPSDSNSEPQVLTIAVIAPETVFARAVEKATPIVESLEFRVP